MSDLCIVTYASTMKRFDRGVARLIDSARRNGFGGRILAFSDSDRTHFDEATGRAVGFNGLGFPWSHSSRMYAWKVECIRRAWAMGEKLVMYLDSSVVVQRPLGPVRDFIVENGRLWGHSGFKCDEWTSDQCLLLMGTTPERAAEIDMILAGLIGFNLDHPQVRQFFEEYWTLAAGATAPMLFNGPHVNHGEVSARAGCRGHRHDQSVMSILASWYGWVPNDPERRLIGYHSWPGDMDSVPLCVRPLP